MKNVEHTPGDRVIRISTAATVIGIGAIAAYVSYRHAYDVATAHGETGATAKLLPLTIDGLVYVASMVMLDAARRRVPAPPLARWALALGIGATVAVNVLHGIAHGPVGAIIAAWPAVTLVLAVELLMTMIRRGRAEPAAGEALVERPAGSVPVAVPAVPAAVFGGAAGVPRPVLAADPHVRAAEMFADDLARGHVPGIRAIKQQLRIGQPKASAVRAYLATLAVGYES